jgi:pyruvate,water dikinase
MDIAVVVQRQIPSTRAGVMFTVAPSSGERNELVIEGSFGLGEAVVSGSVSPDRYVVRKDTLSIVTRSVRPKELAIDPAPDGGTVTRELSAAESMLAVLDDREVLLLARLGVQIERHYGSPQDTEWSFDPDGAPWMLQSRPITTIAHAPGAGGAASAPAHRPVALVHGLGAAPGRAGGAARLMRRPDEAGSSPTAPCSSRT